MKPMYVSILSVSLTLNAIFGAVVLGKVSMTVYSQAETIEEALDSPSSKSYAKK